MAANRYTLENVTYSAAILARDFGILLPRRHSTSSGWALTRSSAARHRERRCAAIITNRSIWKRAIAAGGLTAQPIQMRSKIRISSAVSST